MADGDLASHLKEEVASVLSKYKAKDLPRPPAIIEFPSTADLLECFTTLTDRRVLSAPVYDVDTKEYIGFLDIRDLVTVVVQTDKAARHQSVKDILENSASNLTLEALARKHDFQRVDESSTLLDVATVLRTRAHRVPFFENGVLVNVISQSVIVKFLVKNAKDLPHFKSTTIGAVKIGSSPVIKCAANKPAREVFATLAEKERFGMAVLGEDNSIVTQTSAHDLKLWLQMPSSELLDLSMIKFLQQVRSQDLDIQVPVLACSEKETLLHVLQKLDVTRSHRIFIVDNHFHPIRVVSLTDILSICTD